MQRARGFTLIELLVAISILAMVAVLGWRGLDGIVRARVALTEQMEMTRGMQLAFAQMQSDCEHAADATLLGRRPYLLQAENRITLVRTVFNENEPARLQVIAYRLVDGRLNRRESNTTRDLVELDALWQASAERYRPDAAGDAAGRRHLDGCAGVAKQCLARAAGPGAARRAARRPRSPACRWCWARAASRSR